MRTRRLANIYANIRRRRENKHKQTSPIINKNANKHEQHEQRRDTWHFVSKLPFLAIFRINGSLNPVEISLRMTFAWQSASFFCGNTLVSPLGFCVYHVRSLFHCSRLHERTPNKHRVLAKIFVPARIREQINKNRRVRSCSFAKRLFVYANRRHWKRT